MIATVFRYFPSCRFCVFVLAATGLWPSVALASRIELDAPDSVRALLARHLDFDGEKGRGEDEEVPPGEVTSDQDDRRARLRRLRREIPPLLETEGYFSPQIESKVNEDGSAWVKVSPGVRAVVREVQLEFSGVLAGEAEAYAERRESLRRSWLLAPGAAFRQADWAAAKSQLLTEVSSRDFAAARIVESVADVDPVSAQARLRVKIDSGPAFVLGELDIRGLSLYSRALVERYSPLRVGEAYDYERLLRLQSALQGTSYFSGAIVEIDRDPAKAAAAPVRVTIEEALPKRFGLGLGYSSNTGLRSEANYRNANIFAQALELNSSLRLEQKRQSAFSDFFLPQRSSGFRDSFGLGVLNEDISDLRTRRYSTGVVRSRTLQRMETRTSLNYQHETTEATGAQAQTSEALTLNFGVDLRTTDNPADPREGAATGFQIGGGARNLMSDQNFLRLYARAQYYQPAGRSGTFLLRGEGGYTLAPSRDGIPQDFLFRTGGSQSVRGYDYQSLGVRQGSAVVGGRTLLVTSAEYIWWAGGNWGPAFFLDAGNAADRWRDNTLKLGYGMGGRWRSPAGPLGLDLAYGHSDRRLRLHFTLSLIL
ncbi:autotransporter assembly complex protein TamA [Niveibacterium terrae]|uniref:autotransporter assembly complex protein TamA n=1 Tax=Niveibacterium terrae TaxID=3373598 RepID=UPI003A95D38E